MLRNETLALDGKACRVVYSFVMGGGAGGDASLRSKVKKGQNRNVVSSVKTRCLYEDPECGGTDVSRWTLAKPECNASQALMNERSKHDDITLLSVPENHELGKTDTWFTYASMLSRSRPDLQLGSIGKIDSDNFIRWPVFYKYLDGNRDAMDKHPFFYGGYAIHKKVCSGRSYHMVCANPAFIAEVFAAGAIVYLSTPLAQHVYMDGTTLERKLGVWIVGEDMQLANMAYSDPTMKPYVINHRYGEGGYEINFHCFNDPARYRREYYKLYPKQKTMVGV